MKSHCGATGRQIYIEKETTSGRKKEGTENDRLGWEHAVPSSEERKGVLE